MTVLLVGLGNPGEKYKNNRHNAGFIIVDELALKWGLTWEFNKKFNAEVAHFRADALPRCYGVTVRGDGLILLKPQTFMNDSGEVVSKAMQYLGIDSSSLTVVHDDVDLEALQFKVSHNSSSAGHRGVQNIIDKLGTQDFTRLRVGIGRPVVADAMIWRGDEGRNDDSGRARMTDYVLQDFPSGQLEAVKKQGIEHLLSSLNL